MKRVFSVLLAALMTICFCVTASAEPEPEAPVEPGIIEEYQYTASIKSYLSIIDRTATCQSVVRGIHDLATKVEITHTLQKQIYGYWSDIETWSNAFYSWYGNLVSTRSNLSAGMFRLKTVAKVYCGSNYETITLYSNQVSSVG